MRTSRNKSYDQLRTIFDGKSSDLLITSANEPNNGERDDNHKEAFPVRRTIIMTTTKRE